MILVNIKLGNTRLRIAQNIPHSEMATFVGACDVILCTSYKEGWPNSIKEALACNVPFVSTDVSDLRDIADKEPSCRICPPKANKLADNICDVLLKARSYNLRKHVVGMDNQTTSEKLFNIYNSLI